jgi:hypothetical protein
MAADPSDIEDARTSLASMREALAAERTAFIAVWLIAEDANALRRAGLDHEGARDAAVEFFRSSQTAMNEVQYLADKLDDMAPEQKAAKGEAAP